MVNELKALYHASLQTEGHAAFYRLPEEQTIRGIVAKSMTMLTNSSEGFIVCPFESNQKPLLIPNDVNVQLESEVKLNFGLQNKFSVDFLQSYQYYLKASESKTISPYYNPRMDQHTDESAYIEIIHKAQDEMKLGAFRKAVLSRVKKVSFSKNQDIIDLFLALCEKYKTAFVSLISSPDLGTWLGASPEILLQQQEEKYSTMALAGTKKSGLGAVFSIKEFEEQSIIREYIEGRLKTQNIDGQSFALEEFDAGGLTHLKTTIRFSAKALQRLQLLQELHPTPAVGGYPKESALRFIAENESYKRELYAGYIGPISADEMLLFVNIRCMQWFPEYALVYAGAGITSASNAAAEWEETENKMEIIAAVL